MGLTDKLVESRRGKATEYVSDRLEEGDEVVAVLPMCGTGHPLVPGVRFYGIVLSRKLVIIVGYPKLIETPTSVEFAAERAGITATFKKGMISGELRINLPDGKELPLEVPRIHRKDAEALAEALAA